MVTSSAAVHVADGFVKPEVTPSALSKWRMHIFTLSTNSCFLDVVLKNNEIIARNARWRLEKK
jgi:hypothetical protein